MVQKSMKLTQQSMCVQFFYLGDEFITMKYVLAPKRNLLEPKKQQLRMS